MVCPPMILLLWCLFTLNFHTIDGRVLRRQKRQDQPAPFALPAGQIPYPERSPENLFPLFPFTHQMSSGLEIDDGGGSEIGGELNLPIPGWWGIFDLAGSLASDTSTLGIGLGHLVRPVNFLDIPLVSLANLNRSPQFAAARQAAPEIPVAELPYGYVPARCKPPYCNPFVHQVGFGVEIEDADDLTVEGDLDFPIPLIAPGIGLRFPLAGALETGTSPIAFTYGHALNPVDAFKDVGFHDTRATGPLLQPLIPGQQQPVWNLNPPPSSNGPAVPQKLLLTRHRNNLVGAAPRQKRDILVFLAPR